MVRQLLVVAALLVGLFSFVTFGVEEAAPAGPAKGDTGEIVGTITKLERGKVTVKNEQAELTVWPFWRGGMPKDGGGFDKDTLKQLASFKVGDKVKIAWVFEEHHRIKSIEKAE
jgi:hypothetical protein